MDDHDAYDQAVAEIQRLRAVLDRIRIRHDHHLPADERTLRDRLTNQDAAEALK